MGDRLAHGEEALLQVELAAEQHRDELAPRDSGARGRGDRARASSASRAS